VGIKGVGMGTEVVVSLNNVSKCFKRYAKPIDRLKETIVSRKSYSQEFWALRDVSFEILQGETMGIIGRNGAGKSTLLQLICGTLTPTTGSATVKGRVAALLELGAGFNPEFSGRDNVYMNGSIMGLSKEQIDERFDRIAAFADIHDFIDRPVKTYSSGMYVRLAFSAAIHVEPDILIVDEALAVGDMFFQAKCMSRMRQMMDSGATVLFVSHDIGSVKSLCQRAVLLEGGTLRQVGKTSEVVATYISLIHEDMNRDLKQQLTDTETEISTIDLVASSSEIAEIFVSTTAEAPLAEGHHRYGEGGAKVLDIKLLNSKLAPTTELDSREEFTIQAAIRFDREFPTFCFGYLIKDIQGIDLIGTVTSIEREQMPAPQSGEVYVVEMKVANRLNAGIYTLAFAVELPVVLNQNHIFLDYINDAIVFKVNLAEDPLDRFTSKVYEPAEIKFLQVTN
jgi:ABC-type polysaccharide/polyol phosphate transport system ATPase subunit